jgi:lambda repressor-like predicted transcriptional regulator
MKKEARKHPTSAAKEMLKARGWSYRSAAPELGVTYQHLSEVLNGRRHSRRLLAKVAAIKPRELAVA